MKARLLTLDEIRSAAPSVFAINPSPKVSDRFAFIPTAATVEALMAEGWGVRQVSESRARGVDNVGYQKHMVRFTRVDDFQKMQSLITGRNHIVNREQPLAELLELVMTNAHNGTSKYNLHAGFFRLVCENGLVVAGATFGKLSVRHTGDVNEIVGASYQIIEEAPKLFAQVEAMKQVQLTDVERKQFALGGAMARYGVDNLEEMPVNYERLLAVRRREDQDKTLWNTLNVVQENLVKGGQSIRLGEAKVNAAGRLVHPKRSMKITAVDASMRVNTSLWQMAGEILAAKG